MNCFQNVKYGVSCRDAAERYGVEVNHYGMCVLRSLSPGQLRVRAVLRHFVPYKGVPPLRCLCSYPSALRSGNNLLTQTISTAKSEQLFH